jgi:uncharacterized protein (UPF0332 family)
MKPERFLDLAERLVPEDCRSAISRAYYAVFNVAEDFLRRMNFRRPKQGYHQVLQHRLLAAKDEEIRQIGSDLGDFHEERIEADYDMQGICPAESQANAQAAVKKAAAMIGILNGCPINSDRWKQTKAQIADANVTGHDR